jgi:N-acetyl-anhydromuramyl-L-alanine amidase AmpD
MIPIDRSKKFTENFDKSDEVRAVDFIVLHHIEANSSEHAVEQLKGHGVSSHFLIDESGKIFELVDENDVAYHAGVSSWRGVEGLNKSSIGIEFINSNPCGKRFEEVQMKAGLELCLYLMAKYEMAKEAVIGHSDIAYDKVTNLHDRKQDPSHLFDWELLAENGVGVFPRVEVDDVEIFEIGDEDLEIFHIKEKLQKIGYRVVNLNDEFDLEMKSLGEELDVWTGRSDAVLHVLSPR